MDRVIEGAALAAIAGLLAALLSPAVKSAVRGPGRWLAIRPDEAFGEGAAQGHWMDIGCTNGRLRRECFWRARSELRRGA